MKTWEAAILALANEFKRRRMDKHVEGLRAYFRAFKSREKARLDFYEKRSPYGNPEILHEGTVWDWCTLLRVGPLGGVYPLRGSGQECDCGVRRLSGYVSLTLRTWEGGYLWKCTSCEAEYITLSAAELARLQIDEPKDQ